MRQNLLCWLVLGNLAVAGTVILLSPARAQENRLPPGPGREAVIAACGDCHGLVAIYGKRLPYEAWYGIVGDMMNNGANIPAENRDAIADYLAANFGPSEPVSAAAPAAK